MSVILSSLEREAKKDVHRRAAADALSKLSVLSDFAKVKPKEMYDYAMRHPTT